LRAAGPGERYAVHAQASVGLEFEPSLGGIHFRNPHLPPFLDEVILRNLRLGESSVDLAVRRHGDVSLQVLHSEGTVRVSTILA
jgi:hypothetical protein